MRRFEAIRGDLRRSEAVAGHKSRDNQAQTIFGQLETEIQQGMKELEGMLR